MTTTTIKTVASALFCSAALVAVGAQAADAPGVGNKNLNALTQKVLANPSTTEKEMGVRTLQDYIVQEKELFDFLFKNHPVFKYAEAGRIKGVYKISTRGSEFLGEGNAQGYSKLAGGRPKASQYRLAAKSILDYPNRFVGPERCGECHAIQYEKWKRSRHAQTIRFPGEHPEVDNDLKKKLYNSQASILPDGITPDVIYATVGTPRTKYGYIDAWLVRGAYHIRDGLLRDGTGTLVAGGNQFSRGWAQWLTPERAKEIQKVIPDFPTDMKAMGGSASHQWGMTSYGSSYEKEFLFQPASSYCEVCHAFKFDFKDKKEFFAALGNPKELQKHTISRGISCEECHGAGGHLIGAESNGFQTNCERCHQRSNFVESDLKNPAADGKLEKVDPDEVEVGTKIVVQPGEKVPIDGVIVEGSSTLNTSALTGESLPRDAKEGDEIISGCINMTGVLKIRTTKEFGDSTVSKILDLVENASSRKSKSEAFITRFARIYTPAVVYSAIALAVLPPLVRMFGMGIAADWGTWIYRALTFLVISCPCALVISIPLSFFAGIGGASNAGVLVKGSNYLEILSQTKYVVFDKTGTLTQGVFEVNEVHHNEMDREQLLEYAALAESASSHPISRSLQRAYGKEIDRSRVTDIQEISGNGVMAKVDGISVAAGNAKLMKRLGVQWIDCHHAGTIIHMAIDGEYAGHIVISDIEKPGAKEAVRALRKAGVEKTVMLTGDARKVADHVFFRPIKYPK